jgi:hypothetical protein
VEETIRAIDKSAILRAGARLTLFINMPRRALLAPSLLHLSFDDKRVVSIYLLFGYKTNTI